MTQSGVVATPTAGLVLAVVVTVFLLTVQVSLMVWVYRDARARGSDRPWHWTTLATPPLGGVGLPWYLYHRHRHLDDRAEPSRQDRLLATVASAGLAAMLLGAVLTPPDPYSQIQWIYVAFVALLPPTYVLVYRGAYRHVLGRFRAQTRP